MAKGASKGGGGGGGKPVSAPQAVADEDRFTSLPQSLVPDGKVTKRAEEVFRREYTSTRALAKDVVSRGDYNVSGYNTLHQSDDEPVFTKPVLKGVQHQINSEWKNLQYDVKFNIIDQHTAMTRRYALTMLQNMVNRYYKTI